MSSLVFETADSTKAGAPYFPWKPPVEDISVVLILQLLPLAQVTPP